MWVSCSLSVAFPQLACPVQGMGPEGSTEGFLLRDLLWSPESLMYVSALSKTQQLFIIVQN